MQVLRLIINLSPSSEGDDHKNSVPIEGDVRMFPHFAERATFDVGDGEVMAWGSEDISCTIYVFQIPDWPLCPSL